jgi:hypothetical protein
MKKANLLVLVLGSLVCAFHARAGVDLIAVGSISGSYEDFSTQTAKPLENGVPGNRLGGIGSGLAYVCGNTFLAIPDRGPNANPYNSLVDDTTSYINRFHTLNLSLAPSDAGSTLPFVLTPMLTATTLLSSRTPLYYGNGAGLNLPGGMPALNAVNRIYYFTGRSDNFNPYQPLSTAADHGRFDPESIRVSRDGKSVFISDEYGPHVYQFDRATGRRTRVFELPARFAVTKQSSQGDTEIASNSAGRVANKGMEGLAITPDGRALVGIMQSPLIQDGGTDAAIVRIVTINIATGTTFEYGYELTNIGSAAKPKYGTVSEILAINDHEFLVDERDGKGLGDNSTAAFKRLYRIDLDGAQEISGITGAVNLAGKAVAKTLFLDVVAVLNGNGISSIDIPAKLEGVAFGPDVTVGGVARHTLFIANDNDFIATVNDSNHPAGIDNPNKWFVFAIDSADLPGYVPQRVKLDDDFPCSDRRDAHDGRWR